MIWLKQSTAVVVQMGPYLDKADGLGLKADATTITDIDHATTGIFLSKNGGDAAIRHQNVTASVADDYGMMRVTLDTTDTATLGTLRMSFAKAATYLPVWQDFMVVPANVWDSMFGADLLDVNQAQVLGTAVHAATENGTQCVEVVRWGGNDIAATAVNGVPKVAVTHVNAAAQTATLDTIKAETVEILTDTAVIGALGAGLTGVPWNAAWDAEVQSEVEDALTAYTAPTKAQLDTAQGAVTLANGAHGGAATVITLQTPIVANATQIEGGDATDALAAGTAAALNAANTELAAVPTTISGLRAMIQFLFQSKRNAGTMNKTTGVETLYKEDASTALGTATHTTDGTTVTRGEMN